LAHPGTQNIDADTFQEIGAKTIHKAQELAKKEECKIKLFFDTSITKKQRFFIEKWVLLAQHRDDFFKEEKVKTPTTIQGIIHKNLSIITQGIEIARELTAKPANIVTPEYIENYIKTNLEKDNDLKITYLDKKNLQKENMNLLLAVNQGSEYDPKMIIMEHNPKSLKDKPIVLIGKGITYDSWGYYAKPEPHMNEMYGDMGGAASVIGIMASLKALGIKKHIIWIIWLTENMIDAKSYKNGDIFTARNGKTINIKHTDAEWRLILADMLDYSYDKYKPKLTIDIATLTWSCRAALGEMYTGIFSDNNKLIQTFQKNWEETNDLVRHLPLDKYCKEAVKDKKADLQNTSSFNRILGASTAAAFLSNFVTDTHKRIHCDIAGTALRDQMRKAYDYPNMLGTGPMVHNILHFLKN